MGDAWGSSLSELSSGKGVSLALCQTEKGVELMRMADILTYDIDLDIAIGHNAQLNAPSLKPANWEQFFGDMAKGKTLDRLVKKYMFKAYIRQVVKYICIKLHIVKLGGIVYQINYQKHK